jgi:hypothetical protein
LFDQISFSLPRFPLAGIAGLFGGEEALDTERDPRSPATERMPSCYTWRAFADREVSANRIIRDGPP